MEAERATKIRDSRTLQAMVRIYCRDKHGRGDESCAECARFLDYAAQRLGRCPFGDRKPTCANCTVHCYKPDMRAMAREIMRYSGPRMLKAHPVMAARHLLQGLRKAPAKAAKHT